MTDETKTRPAATPNESGSFILDKGKFKPNPDAEPATITPDHPCYREFVAKAKAEAETNAGKPAPTPAPAPATPVTKQEKK